MLGESSFNRADNFWIAPQPQPECFRYCLSRQIIFRRAQAAADQENIGPRQRRRGDPHNVFQAIANDGLETDFNPETV